MKVIRQNSYTNNKFSQPAWINTSTLLGATLIFCSAFANGGELSIEQDGTESRILTDIVSDSLNFDISLEQTGQNNLLDLRLNSNLVGTISQTGNQGLINFNTSGGSQAISLSQQGQSNTIAIELHGSSLQASLTQDGNSNTIDYSASGSANNATLMQDGSNNRLLLNQVGSNNLANLEQHGSNNTLDVQQFHAGLTLDVIQNGNGDQIIIK